MILLEVHWYPWRLSGKVKHGVPARKTLHHVECVPFHLPCMGGHVEGSFNPWIFHMFQVGFLLHGGRRTGGCNTVHDRPVQIYWCDWEWSRSRLRSAQHLKWFTHIYFTSPHRPVQGGQWLLCPCTHWPHPFQLTCIGHYQSVRSTPSTMEWIGCQ